MAAVCVSSQPKQKRFTTAKAPLSVAINLEDIMSDSDEDDGEGEDEWHPEGNARGRRASKKAKALGVCLKNHLYKLY